MTYLSENISVVQQPTDLPIVLGSSSSNRHTVLTLCGWTFDVAVPDIDEKAIRHDDPYLLPVIIAKAKALAITERTDESCDPFILLTSDQIVLFGTEVREKPTSGAQAVEFLSSYSNREVSTISAVVATHFPSGKQSHEMVKATISFGEISEEIVQMVVAKGAIFHSAGGFRIEDEHLNPLILKIEGSADSVLGMPMDATVRVIRAVIGALP